MSAPGRAAATSRMSWQGNLSLDYRLGEERTLVRDRHDGPLRVLESLHPEGPHVCHSVLVHPPGRIVGGDALTIVISLEPGAHPLGIQAFMPMLAILSSQHEAQYSRLFRS